MLKQEETNLSPNEKIAGSVLMRYLVSVLLLPIKMLFPKQIKTSSIMKLDSATIASLELIENTREGGKKQSLLGVIDQTMTSAGQRLLTRRLCNI